MKLSLKQTGLLTSAAFLASIVLLIGTWLYQQRTNSWIKVPAEIVGSEIHIEGNSFLGWSADIKYAFRGQEFNATVTSMPFGSNHVFVNPNHPTAVVGEQGATMRTLFIPILLVSGTGLFGLVLLLFAFSPADD